jgi:uncharacterized protein (TIRG00374 family)
LTVQPTPSGRLNAFRARHRAITVVVAAAVVVIAVVVLSRQTSYLRDSLATVATADPRWLAAAAALSVFSMSMFAEQQRVILNALGTRMSALRALAVSYAQTSVALTVPAGSAVATAFTVRQLCAIGATTDVAIGTVALSGAASALGLAAFYLGGAVLAGTDQPPSLVQTSITAVTLALTLALPAAMRSVPPVVAHYWRRRAAKPHRRLRAPAFVARRWRRMDRSRRLGRNTYGAVRALRERDWYAAVAFAALNWLADFGCLAAAAQSLHVDFDLKVVGAAYLAVQVGSYLSPLPGGFGVAEPALVVVLCAAGVGLLPATAAMLVYRVYSYWLVAVIGLPLWMRLNRQVRTADAEGRRDADA